MPPTRRLPGFRATLVAVAVALVSPAGVAASPARAQGTDQAAVVARLKREFLIPRAATLATSAAALATSLHRFCAAPRPAGIAQVGAAFAAAADAWAAVSVIRFGPVEEDLAYERLVHYPERNNAIAKGLARLLDPAAPLPDAAGFAGLSVAVQGFSALERLLVEPDAASLARGLKDAAAARRCAVAGLVADAIAARTAAIAAGWRADPVPGLPDGDREVLARAVTDLLTLYKLVGDSKIGAVIGADAASVRPRAGEMWRSGRASRIVALDLAAAADLTDLLMRDTGEEARAVAATARAAAEIARTMPAPIDVLAADPKRRSRVVLLVSALRSARDVAAEAMPPALGITVGFNALDGD
jgi:predicted lipoprotein